MYYIDDDGNPSDRGLVDEPLENEVEVRQRLIKAGFIKDIVLVRVSEEEAKRLWERWTPSFGQNWG